MSIPRSTRRVGLSAVGLIYAGVLPYAKRIDVRTGQPEYVVLLGREHKEVGWSDSEKWAPFGGRPDPRDASAADAAAREAYEESMGFLGSPGDLRELVNSSIGIRTGPEGVLYLAEVPYDDGLPTYFANVVGYLAACKRSTPTGTGLRRIVPTCPEGYLEKTSVAWVPASKVARMARFESARPMSVHVPQDVLRWSFARSFAAVERAVPWLFEGPPRA